MRIKGAASGLTFNAFIYNWSICCDDQFCTDSLLFIHSFIFFRGIAIFLGGCSPLPEYYSPDSGNRRNYHF